jgi:hypothetical protein
MVTNGEKPQAWPLSRKLTLGMAIVFFLVAAVFELALTDNSKHLVGFLFLFMGLRWLSKTWPPPAKR